MLPGAAFSTGSVPPATCRHAAIAREPSTTAATSGTRGVSVGDPVGRLMRAYPGATRVSRREVAAKPGLRFGLRRGRVARISGGYSPGR